MATQEQLDLRRRWVEALRSGKYEQAKGALRTDKGYCCLGVLCDVMGKEWQDYGHFETDRFGDIWIYELAGGNSKTVLPESAQTKIGLRDSSGSYKGTDGYYSMSLAVNNDNGSTFAQIADIIEFNPPGLFID